MFISDNIGLKHCNKREKIVLYNDKGVNPTIESIPGEDIKMYICICPPEEHLHTYKKNINRPKGRNR